MCREKGRDTQDCQPEIPCWQNHPSRTIVRYRQLQSGAKESWVTQRSPPKKIIKQILQAEEKLSYMVSLRDRGMMRKKMLAHRGGWAHTADNPSSHNNIWCEARESWQTYNTGRQKYVSCKRLIALKHSEPSYCLIRQEDCHTDCSTLK